MGLVERLKDLYFAAEDKYYAFLDTVQKRVPVYSVVDPVDKVLPTFGIILALVIALVGLGLFTGLSGILSGGEKIDLDVTFKDAAGGNVSGVLVSLEQEGKVIDSQTTKTNGKVTLSVARGKYDLRAVKDGYEPFSQNIEISQKKSQTFTLTQLIPPAKQRVLLIKDSSGNVLGVSSSVSIALSFSCQSGAPPSDQSSSNGNISFLQPGNCSGLSVSIVASGYISKTIAITSDSTQVVLQSSASLDPEEPISSSTGTVEVFVKGTNASPVDQAQIKLYKVPAAGSNVLSNQTLSDPNGLGIFQNVTPGKHVVIVTKSGFKQTTSAEFQVNAGETVSQTITLPVSSNKRKLFVKVVSSLNQLPVSGASVTLFAQSSSGKMVEYDSYTTDSNGTVKDLLADFNGSTSLVIAHDNYVIDIAPNTGIVPEEQTAPIPIILTPLAAPNANGNIPNALIINVKATDEVGLTINHATTRLFSPDLNGVVVKVVNTNTLGVAKFSNLPAGDYQATVSTTTADGNSSKVNGNVNQTLNLPVTLTLGNALVKVIVKDELNTLIADANVSIYSASENTLLTKGTTNAQGLVQLGVSTGQQVYVRVDKAPFLPFISIPFDVLKNNTHTINIEVSLTNPSQAADISLTRIDQISSLGVATLANSLANGGLYAFHFTVKSSLAQNNMKAVVRVNGDNTTAHNSSLDVGSILGGQSAKGGLGFFLVNNPTSPFSPSSPSDSNTPSKVVVNTLGDVNVSSYELVVLVKIRPTPNPVPPVADKLEIRFQAQSDVSTNTTSYFETYTIGQPLNQSNFSFVFLISGGTFTSPIQINGGYPVVLEKDVDYTLDYQISNTSGSSPANAVLVLNKDVPSLVTSVPTISLSNFTNNSVASGSFTLHSTQECGGPPASNTAYCATLTPTITGTTTTPAPAFPIRVFTTPSKALFANVSPSYLVPGHAQLVQVVVRDQLGSVANTSQGVLVKGQVKDSSGQNVDGIVDFTSSPSGVYTASINSYSSGNTLEITASASGYVSSVTSIPFSDLLSFNQSQDFSCLTFTPASTPLTFELGDSATLNVRTTNCPSSLKFYTEGFTPPGNGSSQIKVSLKGPASQPNLPAVLIDQSNPYSLPANGANVNLTVLSPSNGIGQYPLYVRARFDNQPTAPFVLLENIDVVVEPVGGVSSQCLGLSKYVFDLRDGSDSAEVVNNCNPFVHDVYYPRVSTQPIQGGLLHTIPSVLTPELQNPTMPITFNYSVDVDYDFTNSPYVNLSSEVPPVTEDGQYALYKDNSTSSPKWTRMEYGSSPTSIINDFPRGGDSDDWYVMKDVYNNANALFESVLFFPKVVGGNPFNTDVCIMNADYSSISGDVDWPFVVSIDGERWDRAVWKQWQFTESGGEEAFCRNITFAPGPHLFRLYAWNGNNGRRHQVKIMMRKPGYISNLSGAGAYAKDVGQILSPEYSIPFANDNLANDVTPPFVPPKTNGLYSENGSGNLSPLNGQSPRVIGSIANMDVAKILSNNSGIDHVKLARVHVETDNPSIRAFVKGKDVYAQFVGYDDPHAKQYVMAEDVGINPAASVNGEQYGVVALEDYTSHSLSSQTVVDVGVLLDASPSVILGEVNEQGTMGPIRQAGICSLIKDIKDSLEYHASNTKINNNYQKLSVNLKIALMGDVNYFYSASNNPALNIPCINQWPNVTILPPGDYTTIPGTTYTPDIHDMNEAWAYAAEKFATDSFWNNPDNQKVMIVITDNKPSGLGKNALQDAWDVPLEETLVLHASTVLSNKSTPSGVNTPIRGVVLYRTPLESTSKDNYPASGGNGSSDAIALYDLFASHTNGFVEALDSSEIIADKNNRFAWDHAHYNKIGIRLAQTIFPKDTTSAVVKVVTQPANACVGELGQLGSTGSSAFPNLAYDWRWTKITKDLCDFKSSTPNVFTYCDSTQFLVSLIKKLEELKVAYSPTATPAQVASIPSLQNFDSYLMYDGLSTDFRDDFVSFYDQSQFSDALPYFKGTPEGQWKDYVSSPTRLTFEIDGVVNPPKIPAAGLYRAVIEIDWDDTNGSFFSAGSPNASVNVSLTKIAEASALSNYSVLYEFPLDGAVGADIDSLTYHRNGYGTTFTGPSVVDLVQTNTAGLTVRSYPNQPGNVSLNTYAVSPTIDVVGLNTTSRGQLFVLDKSAGTLFYQPSLPVPIAMEWASNSSGVGSVYYAIKETGSPSFVSVSGAAPSFLKWTPYASVEKQQPLSCTGNNCDICLDGGSSPYVSSIVMDTVPPSGVGGFISGLSSAAGNVFGFSSSNGFDNNAFLSSVFYYEPSKDYTIYYAKNNQTPYTGRILTPNGLVDGSPSTIPLDYSSDTAFQTRTLDSTSFAGALSLVDDQFQPNYACITNSSNKVEVYWNASKIKSKLLSTQGAPAFGQTYTCTTGGSSFNPSDIFSLSERVSPLTAPTIGFPKTLCPLFNALDVSAGYFGQSGVPYPIGTKIINESSPANPVLTSDPLSGLVQYRHTATACASNASNLCFGVNSSDACTGNTERYWSPLSP